jgi:hypothetical protein
MSKAENKKVSLCWFQRLCWEFWVKFKPLEYVLIGLCYVLSPVMNSLSVCQFSPRTESSCVVTTQSPNLKLWFRSWCNNPFSFPLVNIYLWGQYIIILTSKEGMSFYLLQVLILDTWNIKSRSGAIWDHWPVTLGQVLQSSWASSLLPETQWHGCMPAEPGWFLQALQIAPSPVKSIALLHGNSWAFSKRFSVMYKCYTIWQKTLKNALWQCLWMSEQMKNGES